MIETAIVNCEINVKEFILCSWLKARILIGWKKWFLKKIIYQSREKNTQETMNYLQKYREKKKEREKAMLQKMALDWYKSLSEDKKRKKRRVWEKLIPEYVSEEKRNNTWNNKKKYSNNALKQQRKTMSWKALT